MGILITRRPDFDKMKKTSDWLDRHPEETQKIIEQLEADNMSDEELDAINRSGANIDYGGRIQINKEKFKNK